MGYAYAGPCTDEYTITIEARQPGRWEEHRFTGTQVEIKHVSHEEDTDGKTSKRICDLKYEFRDIFCVTQKIDDELVPHYTLDTWVFGFMCCTAMEELGERPLPIKSEENAIQYKEYIEHEETGIQYKEYIESEDGDIQYISSKDIDSEDSDNEDDDNNTSYHTIHVNVNIVFRGPHIDYTGAEVTFCFRSIKDSSWPYMFTLVDELDWIFEDIKPDDLVQAIRPGVGDTITPPKVDFVYAYDY